MCTVKGDDVEKSGEFAVYYESASQLQTQDLNKKDYGVDKYLRGPRLERIYNKQALSIQGKERTSRLEH